MSVKALEARLNEALENEDYERASQIQDQIDEYRKQEQEVINNDHRKSIVYVIDNADLYQSTFVWDREMDMITEEGRRFRHIYRHRSDGGTRKIMGVEGVPLGYVSMMAEQEPSFHRIDAQTELDGVPGADEILIVQIYE